LNLDPRPPAGGETPVILSSERISTMAIQERLRSFAALKDDESRVAVG